MLTTKKCNVLHNRCDCMNRVHEYANKIVPELLVELAKGFKLTNSYQFYAKDKERLQAILDAHEETCTLSQGSTGRKGSRAYLKSDEYNICLELSDNYPERYHTDGSGGYTCSYYNKTVYLWNHKEDTAQDFVFLPLHTHNQMDVAKAKLIEVQDEINELQNQVYPLKRLIGE